jgi:hypothetical protein
MTRTNRQIAIKRAAADSSREYLDLTIPYWFSSMARRRQENIQVSDYVKVRGLDNKYEIIDIFPQFGSCRVRAIGETSCLLIPWAYVSPWEERRTSALTQAIGNWLLRGSRVYLSSEPDRMLKTVKINWNRGTSDVEDEHGRVSLDISWDDLEFWNPEDYHLAGE